MPRGKISLIAILGLLKPSLQCNESATQVNRVEQGARRTLAALRIQLSLLLQIQLLPLRTLRTCQP